MMPAVVNTSPIILLDKVRRLELLVQLYGIPVVPPAVVTELRAKPGASLRGIDPFLQSVEIKQPANALLVRALSADLGAGEAEAISLAAEVPGSLLVMDDGEGRRMARALGLPVTGTAGILVEAKVRGLLPAIAPLLDQLVTEGLWLSETMRRAVLDAAGE